MNNIDNTKYSMLGYTPKLILTKSTNKTAVKIGDTFNYTIRITNLGNVEVTSIKATDILPSIFLIESIKLDGIVVPGDISIGLDIGDLGVGDSKTLILTIKVLADLIKTFNNVVDIQGSYYNEINQQNEEITESAMEPIGVKIFNPELKLYKSTNNQYAVVDEIVTYTVIAYNTGDIPLENVTISDVLSSELDFIEGSITIDGSEAPEEIITSGVNVGGIGIGISKTITFKAKVLSNKFMKIINISVANYDFILEEPYIQGGSVNSNEVVIYIEKASVKVVKKVDKTTVSLDEELTYIVNLINDGTLEAMNVKFIDNLPESLEIINGTFKVNGEVINSVSIRKGVNIGNIPVMSTTIVEYKAKVVAGVCTGNIINEAKVKFRYVLPDGIIAETESKIDKESSTLVAVNLTTFKQISVDEYLIIPQIKPDIECINNIIAEVEILSSHVVNTTKDRSNEAQVLSGYKLIVHGVLNQVVEYTAMIPEQTVHTAHYNVPFSSFIILPENFKVGSKIEVEGIVEDIYYKEHDCRRFFKNVTLLLVAKIILCK